MSVIIFNVFTGVKVTRYSGQFLSEEWKDRKLKMSNQILSALSVVLLTVF
jgi:hypothetical protein